MRCTETTNKRGAPPLIFTMPVLASKNASTSRNNTPPPPNSQTPGPTWSYDIQQAGGPRMPMPNGGYQQYAAPGNYTRPNPSGLPDFAKSPQRPAGTLMLKDSNPGLFRQQPQLQATPQAPANGRLQEVIGGGGMGGMGPQGGAGAILGSSMGAPSFYGGGLAPASGLGGGLYPSLLSLYR